MGHFLNPEQSDEKREARRDLAAEQFQEAARIARERCPYPLRLRRVNDTHYQLRGFPPTGPWLIHIYPGNRRVYNDPHKGGPYLKLSAEWTLLEVVRAAVRTMERKATP